MKELELYEVLPMIRKDLGRDTITVYDLNIWCQIHEKDHPDIYINRTRNDIHHAHNSNFIWLECPNEGSDILHKQESLKCPICGEKLFKHPDVEKFEKMKLMTEHLKDIAKKIGI
jgi:uncharacterized Zn-finger protein